MTLAKFLVDHSGQGLDWEPHAQLMGPTGLAAAELLTSPHLSFPAGPRGQEQEEGQNLKWAG